MFVWDFMRISKFFLGTCFVIACLAIIFINHDFKKLTTPINTHNAPSTDESNVNVIYEFNKPLNSEDANKNFGDIQDIVKRGEIVVCALKNPQNPLFQMKVGTNFIGEDITLAKKLAENLGVKLVYRMIYKSYDDVINAIAKGEGDIGIAKLSYTPDRSRKVLYSTPYVNSRKVMLINRLILEKNKLQTIDELFQNHSETIAVTKDTSYETFAKKIFPNANIVSNKDWENYIIPKLEKGEFTATMRDEVRIKLLLNENPKLLLKLLPIILKNEHDSMSAVVNLKNSAFLNWVNKFLELEYTPKNVDELIKKYETYIK